MPVDNLWISCPETVRTGSCPGPVRKSLRTGLDRCLITQQNRRSDACGPVRTGFRTVQVRSLRRPVRRYRYLGSGQVGGPGRMILKNALLMGRRQLPVAADNQAAADHRTRVAAALAELHPEAHT